MQVIAPQIDSEMMRDLDKMSFVSLITDTSNRKAVKMLPVLVRGFDEEKGVIVYKLNVKLITNETSETIGNELVATGTSWKLKEKVVAFGADNCNTNFGGVERKGQNNVFFRLKELLQRDILGVGCVSHIIHNAFDTACDQLPIEVEHVVVKIFKHFDIFTKRTEALKEICNDNEINYTKLIRHSGTRFLTLYPAVVKIIKLFVPLKVYFDGLIGCPVTIKKFFANDSALFWLHFLDSQLKMSNDYVLKTETKKSSSFEVAAMVVDLLDTVQARANENFIPVNAQPLLDNFSQAEIDDVNMYLQNFYDSLTSYLQKWSKSLDGTEIFAWMNLTVVPDWTNDVEPSFKFAQEHGAGIINGDKVFDETHLIKQVITNKLPAWTEKGTTSEARWIEVFGELNKQRRPIKDLSLLVQYAFCIPGTSTEVERLFSTINNVWVSGKDNMSLHTLEAYLSVSVNSVLSCAEFYDSVKTNKTLLAKVQGGEKYKKAAANTQPSTSTSSEVNVVEADSESEEYLFHGF